ncbi:MAG: DNA methyltransferase [Rhodobacteraceae bacterium]|nr:DNA methyltransferase [Paracoccaceae bacterium]
MDLIATDPPFNKGRDFHATPDSLASGAKFQDRWSWEQDVHNDWVDQLTDDYPRLMEAIESARYAHSDGMGAYICFMAVRLLEMRRVLKPTGSIYLHCDPTASHYLKAVMDAVFGWRNFVNEVLWLYKTGGMSKRWFGRKHDNVLLYSKTKKYTFNPLKEKSYLSHKYGFSNVEILQDENGIYTLAGMRDYWDIPALRGNQPETVGYPTQKPVSLYERMLKASSNPGDIVLDPFCGCATTLVAAEQLDRQWVGMDIWEGAHKLVRQRLEGTTGLFGDVVFTDKLPIRTDEGDQAAPFLRVKVEVKEPDGPRWTRAQMYEHLLEQHGAVCQGCDRSFDDPRYLELDHNTPRSDGGVNHVTNRILLCGPCNKLKSNIYTLSGLRKENKKRGYMHG